MLSSSSLSQCKLPNYVKCSVLARCPKTEVDELTCNTRIVFCLTRSRWARTSRTLTRTRAQRRPQSHSGTKHAIETPDGSLTGGNPSILRRSVRDSCSALWHQAHSGLSEVSRQASGEGVKSHLWQSYRPRHGRRWSAHTPAQNRLSTALDVQRNVALPTPTASSCNHAETSHIRYPTTARPQP